MPTERRHARDKIRQKEQSRNSPVTVPLEQNFSSGRTHLVYTANIRQKCSFNDKEWREGTEWRGSANLVAELVAVSPQPPDFLLCAGPLASLPVLRQVLPGLGPSGVAEGGVPLGGHVVQHRVHVFQL